MRKASKVLAMIVVVVAAAFAQSPKQELGHLCDSSEWEHACGEARGADTEISVNSDKIRLVIACNYQYTSCLQQLPQDQWGNAMHAYLPVFQGVWQEQELVLVFPPALWLTHGEEIIVIPWKFHPAPDLHYFWRIEGHEPPSRIF